MLAQGFKLKAQDKSLLTEGHCIALNYKEQVSVTNPAFGGMGTEMDITRRTMTNKYNFTLAVYDTQWIMWRELYISQ